MIERKYHSLIRKTLEEQLTFEPETETRNRKPLREPLGPATWEVRFGPGNRFRALYSIDQENHEVVVHRIGVKDGSNLELRESEEES